MKQSGSMQTSGPKNGAPVNDRLGAVCRSRGFTLIELMIAVAVLAILASIALPSYDAYVKKSRARSAGSDLAALSLNVENHFQKKLTYPTNATAISEWQTGWSASQGAYFTYSSSFSDTNYVLTATGKSGMQCTLTLTVPHQGAITRSASGADCGFTTW